MTSPGKHAHEDALIGCFLAYLHDCTGVSLAVHSHPDRQERDATRCDALLRDRESGQRPRVAVEVTSIDPFLRSRHDDHELNRLAAPLNDDPELIAVAPGFVWVVLDVGALRGRGIKPMQTAAVLAALRASLRHELPRLTDHRPRRIVVPPWGVQVSIRLDEADRTPTIYVARFIPAFLEDQRREVLRETLLGKTCQVQPYRDRGLATVLLLAAHDMALTRPGLVTAAFSHVLGAHPGIADTYDNIVLIETQRADWRVTPLKMSTWPAVPMTSWRLHQPTTA